MKLLPSEVWVIVANHNRGGYGIYDTSEPDELYTVKEEALKVAEEMNAQPAFLGMKGQYVVEALSDRLYDIKSACRDEGENNYREGEDRRMSY